MWPLPRPFHSAAHSYAAVVSTTRSGDRRKLLLGAVPTVRKAGHQLRRAAVESTLHDLDEKDFTVPEIEGDTFVEWAYDNGMSATKGKRIRDELMAAPRNKRCPLCSQGTVSELDHFVPKSLYPTLCVDPLNLVPACERCNKLKSNMRPRSAEDTLLHPYLDRISHERWLDARTVHEPESPRLEFFVSPPDTWDTTLTTRVQNHFTLLQLGQRYAPEANRLIYGWATLWDDLRRRGGSILRNHLLDDAASWFSKDPNSVEGVTFATLADDDAFCRTKP
ncbi:HNH endonuclease [Streptomyces erythrochromogenes]|uniref:HNH endonuclease n=1 Tax=Streptomyces erythrochromogenes TaxID=285574 RepID=UPI00386B098F|nr:HNH endonuclease [Streptomyces erythrochromogenes]WST98358.1 HNH endonuclease [Streptomyces erythrochromogenes]